MAAQPSGHGGAAQTNTGSLHQGKTNHTNGRKDSGSSRQGSRWVPHPGLAESSGNRLSEHSGRNTTKGRHLSGLVGYREISDLRWSRELKARQGSGKWEYGSIASPVRKKESASSQGCPMRNWRWASRLAIGINTAASPSWYETTRA